LTGCVSNSNNNTAGFWPGNLGGLVIGSSSSVTVDNCTIAFGQAYVGAAIYSDDSIVNVRKSRLHGNYGVLGTIHLAGR